MMDMKLLAVVTPTSVYNGCSTWTTFLEKNFTCEENITLGEFSSVNMKYFGRRNVRRHRYIKINDKYVTLDILLKFVSPDKMRITSSDPKDNLGRSGKGLINYPGIKAKSSTKKEKKAKYAIGNFSMKGLLNIIREFEKFPYKNKERRRTKHERTDSYFYQERQLAKCMMISNALNSYVYPVRT